MTKRPAIVSDVDGVLIQGRHPIPGVREALIKMQMQIKDINSVIDPTFCLLTNGGGKPERDKIESINNILQLPSESRLTESQIVCQYTPLKDLFTDKLKNKLVLIGGTLDIHGMAQCCGIMQYLTFDEYAYLWPQSCMCNLDFQTSEIDRQKGWEINQQQTREKVKKRLGDRLTLQKEPPLAEAILILYNPNNYELMLNIMFYQYMQQPIPIYLTNHDIEAFSSCWPIPRLVYGTMELYIMTLLQDKGFEPIIVQYGKPFSLTYDYVKKHLKRLAKNDVNFSNTYMIGDSPQSDIRGGNQAGWTTILVTTGLYKPTDSNHNLELISSHDKPDYIVKDFAEALELIRMLELAKN